MSTYRKAEGKSRGRAQGQGSATKPRSVLGVDILAQNVIDGRLIFGMPAFEPFQNIGIKPQGGLTLRLFQWHFRRYCAGGSEKGVIQRQAIGVGRCPPRRFPPRSCFAAVANPFGFFQRFS